MTAQIKLEKAKDIWQEMEALFRLEAEEIEEQRPLRPDWESVIGLNNAGLAQIMTARVDGKMVGYFTWLIDFDMESKGTLIANQATWFVERGYPTVGAKLLDRAIAEFKRAGVEFAYFHHTLKGRGATLGRLFESKGATLLSYNYVLQLKGAEPKLEQKEAS